MARVRDMQGVYAHITTIKTTDGVRRHPAHCIFAKGKGKDRYCNNEQSQKWKEHCRTASKCDFYEEKEG